MHYEDQYEPENVVVIYHGPCNDGFTAAWAAWMKFGDQARYYQTTYGKPPIEGLKGKDVFILDFSYPRDILEKIKAEANSLLVLDHHVTAEKALEGLDYATFDQTRSGCGMSWDYFHGTGRPKIINHAEDSDLWKFEFENTKEIFAVMEMTEKTFDNWTELFTNMENPETYGEMVLAGAAAMKYKNFIVRNRFAKKPTYIYLDNNIVPAANSTVWQSEIGAQLAKNNDAFAAIWFQLPDGRIKVSLRSDKNVGMDVEAIAKKYGGGGHKNAASFITDRVPTTVNWEEVDAGMK